MKKIFWIVTLSFLSVVFALCFLIFKKQDVYSWVLNWTWFSQIPFSEEKNLEFYTGLYTDFLLAYIGVYFTVLGIAFSLKSFSVLTFYKFTFDIFSGIQIIVLLVNTTVVYCFLPNIRFTNAVVCYLLFNILYLTLLFCFFCSRIFYTDNLEWAKKLFSDVLKKRHREDQVDFENNFLAKCFEEEFPTLLSEDPKNASSLELFQSIEIRSIHNSQVVEKLLFSVQRKILQLLKEEEIDVQDVQLYIDVFFRFHTYYMYDMGIDNCHFLMMRDCFLFTGKDNPPDSFYECYAYTFVKMKDLILTALYNKDEETIYSYINQMRNCNQFYFFRNSPLVSNTFERELFVISTFMYNLIVVGKKDRKLYQYARQLFFSLNKIRVCCVTEIAYDEGYYTEIDFHEARYTEEFLIALILLLEKIMNPEFDLERFISDKIVFIGYGNFKSSHAYSIATLSCLLRAMEKITANDVYTFIPECKNFSKVHLNCMIIIENMIDTLKEQELSRLQKVAFDSKIKENIKAKKEKLQSELKAKFPKEFDDKNYKPFNIDYEFLFSLRSIEEGKKVFEAGSFYHAVKDLFIDLFIQKATCKKLKTFAELADIRVGKLFINSGLLDKLFDDKKVEIGYQKFSVKNNIYEYEFFRSQFKGVIFQEDFMNHFALRDIIVYEERMYREKTTEDVLVHVPVKVVFGEKQESSVWYFID